MALHDRLDIRLDRRCEVIDGELPDRTHADATVREILDEFDHSSDRTRRDSLFFDGCPTVLDVDDRDHHHGQFTDVPVLAETLGRMMSLDVGEGEFAVINKLRNISAVVQTVPRLDGSIGPAAMQYQLDPPLFVTDPRSDTRMIVDGFREATNEMVRSRHRHGVKARSRRAADGETTSCVATDPQPPEPRPGY